MSADQIASLVRVRARKRQGRCYELSFRGVMKCSEATLVQGEVTINRPGAMPLRMGHAWIELHGKVYDPVMDQTYTPADYRNRFRAVPAVAYPCKVAAKTALEHGHYGPWHDVPVI